MASELSKVIIEYKEIMKKVRSVEENFERYKIEFSREFKAEIAKIEADKIDKIKRETQSQQNTSEKSKPSPPPQVEVKVNVRKMEKKGQNKKPQSIPAKVTKVNDKNEAPQPTPNPTPAPELKSAKAKPNDDIKVTKLYRKLCKIFHPDLCDDDSNFLKIQKCYENNNITDLIEVAVDNKVNIDEYIDNPKQMIEQWRSKINQVKVAVSSMTQMLPWVWCVSNNKKAIRNNIVRNLQRGTGVKLQ